MKTILKKLGVVLAVAFLTVWFAFPVDAALEFAKRKVSGSGSMSLTFKDAWMGLGGPTVEGIHLGKGKKTAHIDRATVRPRLKTLIFNPGLSIAADVGDGSMDVNTGVGDSPDIHFQFEDFDVLKAGIGTSLPLGINLDGDLSGHGDLVWSKNPKEVTGEINLVIADAMLFGNTLPLPSTTVSIEAIKLKLKADAGLIEIAPLAIDGDEIWGSIRGTIKLDSTLARSKADIKIRLHFSPEIETAIGPLLSLPGTGFKKQKDAWIRQFRGPLHKLGLTG